MRRGRTVSRPVRTTLCMKSARMAASMRGMVRRVSIGCRCAWETCLGLGNSNGSVGDGGGCLDGCLVGR